jgi:hypothetical protein
VPARLDRVPEIIARPVPPDAHNFVLAMHERPICVFAGHAGTSRPEQRVRGLSFKSCDAAAATLAPYLELPDEGRLWRLSGVARACDLAD